MTDPLLPAWEGDPLSRFVSDAQRNERVSPLKLPDVYALLQRVHDAFQQVATITEHEHNPNLLATRFLMARTWGAWLGAARLGLSGQTVEAYPVVRTVVENAWYALHIAKDPSPPARAQIWLNRDHGDAAQKQCAMEFSIKSVRETHEALDAADAAKCDTVYKRTIEYGGHPNERGVLTAMTRTASGGVITFGAVFLTNDPKLIAMVLKTTVEAAVGAMRAFRLIFPERFRIMELDLEIDKIVGDLNTVFKPFVDLAPRDTSRRSA